MDTAQKFTIGPMVKFLSASFAVVAGCLFRFRILPFLESETLIKGDKAIPMADFASNGSNMFFFGSLVFFALGVYGVMNLTEEHRRYISQLPRWRQWMIWPFHGIHRSEPRNAPAEPR